MRNHFDYVNAYEMLDFWKYDDDTRAATFLFDVAECGDRDDMDDNDRRNIRDAADVINDVLNDVTPYLAGIDAPHRCDTDGDDPMYVIPYAACAESGYVIGDSTRHDWYGAALQVVTIRDMRRMLHELMRDASLDPDARSDGATLPRYYAL